MINHFDLERKTKFECVTEEAAELLFVNIAQGKAGDEE